MGFKARWIDGTVEISRNKSYDRPGERIICKADVF